MLRKLPEFVFVSIREPGEDEFLDCRLKGIDAVEDDGPTLVGTYKLVETNELAKRVTSKSVRNKVKY